MNYEVTNNFFAYAGSEWPIKTNKLIVEPNGCTEYNVVPSTVDLALTDNVQVRSTPLDLNLIYH